MDVMTVDDAKYESFRSGGISLAIRKFLLTGGVSLERGRLFGMRKAETPARPGDSVLVDLGFAVSA